MVVNLRTPCFSNVGRVKVFDGHIEALRKATTGKIVKHHEKFVDATSDGLVYAVVACIDANAKPFASRTSVYEVEEQMTKAIHRLSTADWLKTSPLKNREKEVKTLLDLRSLKKGKLKNELQDRLQKFISKWYAYMSGTIVVSCM